MNAQTLQCPAAATFKRYLCFVKHHGWRVFMWCRWPQLLKTTARLTHLDIIAIWLGKWSYFQLIFSDLKYFWKNKYFEKYYERTSWSSNFTGSNLIFINNGFRRVKSSVWVSQYYKITSSKMNELECLNAHDLSLLSGNWLQNDTLWALSKSMFLAHGCSQRQHSL